MVHLKLNFIFVLEKTGELSKNDLGKYRLKRNQSETR